MSEDMTQKQLEIQEKIRELKQKARQKLELKKAKRLSFSETIELNYYLFLDKTKGKRTLIFMLAFALISAIGLNFESFYQVLFLFTKENLWLSVSMAFGLSVLLEGLVVTFELQGSRWFALGLSLIVLFVITFSSFFELRDLDTNKIALTVEGILYVSQAGWRMVLGVIAFLGSYLIAKRIYRILKSAKRRHVEELPIFTKLKVYWLIYRVNENKPLNFEDLISAYGIYKSSLKKYLKKVQKYNAKLFKQLPSRTTSTTKKKKTK
jgi:hypothetical protein